MTSNILQNERTSSSPREKAVLIKLLYERIYTSTHSRLTVTKFSLLIIVYKQAFSKVVYQTQFTDKLFLDRCVERGETQVRGNASKEQIFAPIYTYTFSKKSYFLLIVNNHRYNFSTCSERARERSLLLFVAFFDQRKICLRTCATSRNCIDSESLLSVFIRDSRKCKTRIILYPKRKDARRSRNRRRERTMQFAFDILDIQVQVRHRRSFL